MAFEIPGMVISLKAGADLSEKRYYAVKLDGSGEAILAGSTDLVTGIVINDPILGDTAAVMTSGVSMVAAGAVIAIGARVKADGTGRAIVAVADTISFGQALESADAAGQIISVLLQQVAIL